jgi:hypothetical protein
LAAPTQAIIWTCDDICTCALSCSTLCRPAPNHPYTTCGALGLDCIQNCGASAGLTSAPAPACTSDGSEAPLFAVSAQAPASAEDTTQPAN